MEHQHFGKQKGVKTRSCSKCGGDLGVRFGKQSYCKSCHAKYMREHRPKYKDLPEEAKKKANARSYTREYIKRGYIKRKPCEVCGAKAEAHHDDYDKPTEIRWLCRQHHLEHHRKEALTPTLIKMSEMLPFCRDELRKAKITFNLTDFGLKLVSETAIKYGVDFERANKIALTNS